MKKDDSQANRILEQFGWVDIKIDEHMLGAKDKVVSNLEVKCAALEKEQENLGKKAKSVIEDKLTILEELWRN